MAALEDEASATRERNFKRREGLDELMAIEEILGNGLGIC